MDRRIFIKNSGLAAAGLGLSGATAFAIDTNPKNKLPKWKGFNLTDFFNPDPQRSRRATKEEELKWMQDWGFDFIRLPTISVRRHCVLRLCGCPLLLH